MRPAKLVLENFGSFRGRHTVSFDGIELFVLAGPTGAGKSTILDAITMALYGSVARYDNANLIEPAINRLATQATVSLSFAVADRPYVVTRLLRRTATGGATAAEVRLERLRGDGPTEVMASGSREVESEVVRLLGLTFDEFCKTVVLPQGAFAQFLHGGRRERQELLVRLLGLEVYAEVGQAARTRATGLAGEIGGIDAQLTRLGDVDEAAVAAARRRADALRDVRERVADELWPRLEACKETWTTAKQQRDEAERHVTALAALTRPDGVDELAVRVRDADGAVEQARGRVDDAVGRGQTARRVLADAPDPGPLTELLRIDEEVAGVLAELEQLTAATDAARRELDEARATADTAEDAARTATEHVEELERRHLAHTLGHPLGVGDACPVCFRPIEERPEHPQPAGLSEARATASELGQRASTQRAAAGRAETAAMVAADRVATAEARLIELRERLDRTADGCGVTLVGGRLDRPPVDELLRAHREAADALDAAQRAESEARAALTDAQRSRERLDGEVSAAWRAFDGARDTVAGLGAPPITDRDDIAAAWETLIGWRGERLQAARSELDTAERGLARAHDTGRQQAERILTTVTDAGIQLSEGTRPEAARDRLTEAAAAADHEATELRQRHEQAAQLRTDRAEKETDRQVAELVGALLRRDQFEQWLLNRLSTQLVGGASRILNELTQGAFSLVLDPERGTFEVVDHLNADERRSAKTLSGGETFLASLALALALADHVAAVNQAGAARLDALFLDEGFGSLDVETLDTVATAIEELSASRMVGVITHVRELAARLPYRFDVHRGPDGSTIRPAPDEAPPELADLEETG